MGRSSSLLTRIRPGSGVSGTATATRLPTGATVSAEVGKTYVKVRLFGDNGGRRVERKVSGRFQIKEPPDEYLANDSIDPEEEEVKEPGQAGWSRPHGGCARGAQHRYHDELRTSLYHHRQRAGDLLELGWLRQRRHGQYGKSRGCRQSL